MSKRIFANMVAVAVMIAMAAPAMAQNGPNYGAGVSTQEIVIGSLETDDTCAQPGYAISVGISGNGNSARLTVSFDRVPVFTTLERPVNNALNTVVVEYSDCWTLVVQVRILGNSIVVDSATAEWIEHCVCIFCYNAAITAAINAAVAELCDEGYTWRFGCGTVGAANVGNLVYWVDGLNSSLITVTINGVDYTFTGGNDVNSGKSLWINGVLYTINMRGNFNNYNENNLPSFRVVCICD